MKFYWDFHGNGSWTASTATMHPDCQPVDDKTRSRINGEATIRRYEAYAEKILAKAENASRPKTVRRLEREAERYANEAKKMREQYEQETK